MSALAFFDTNVLISADDSSSSKEQKRPRRWSLNTCVRRLP